MWGHVQVRYNYLVGSNRLVLICILCIKDTLKKIYIKKTEVCYSSRSRSGGHLCFCEQDLCNTATHSIKKLNISNMLFFSFLFVMFKFNNLLSISWLFIFNNKHV